MDLKKLEALESACIEFYRSDGRTSQVCNAIFKIYQNKCFTFVLFFQAQFHDLLTQAQCSMEAWSFCWEMMQAGKPCEVQFFGATTLHTKLMKYWHEVPEELQNDLKTKLLQAIVTYATGPKLVLNRLCISLSAFVVYTIHEWPTAIQDIMNLYFPNIDKNTQVWIIYEILAGIPEMANAIHMSVQRTLIRVELGKQTGLVMRCCEQYINTKVEVKLEDEDLPVLQNTAKCVKEWIMFTGRM